MAAVKETNITETKPKTTRRKATAKNTDEKDLLIAKMQEQMEAMSKQLEELKAAASATPSVIVNTPVQKSERVHFLWQAPVADDNIIDFGLNGMYGRIVGKSGSFYVPKDDLSKIMTAEVRGFIESRWLIVVSGMTDEEREAFGVKYSDGEILDNRAFMRIVEIGDEILSVYPNLCKSHKEMVAKRYYEAWAEGSPYVTRERVIALYKIDSNKAFKKILEGMNQADLG